MKKITFLICFVLFNTLPISAQFTFPTQGPVSVSQNAPVTLNLNDLSNSAGVTSGLYDSFIVSVDWVSSGNTANDPWSNDTSLSVNTTSGGFPIAQPTSGGVNNPDPAAITFEGSFDSPYDPDTDGFLTVDLFVNFGGDLITTWSNINVVLIPVPTCPAVSDIMATSINQTSADFSWTPIGTESLWNVELVDVTAGGTQTMTPTEVGLTTASYSASGLVLENDYELYVQADCGVTDGTSTWTGPFSFSTLSVCPAPINLNVSSITGTSADLGWTEQGGATTWNIELVNLTAGDTQTMVATDTGVTTNPFVAMGLIEDNLYEFYVQADCGSNDGISTWAGPFTFSTYIAQPANCETAVFLDTGGNAAGYGPNESITTVITPDASGNAVTIEFTYVDIEANDFQISDDSPPCFDSLSIYNGPTTASPVLAENLCGQESGNGTVSFNLDNQLSVGDVFTSTDASGSLTVTFTSDGFSEFTGWAATVTCATLSLDTVSDIDFFYYPNPTTNKLMVEAKNQVDSVSIYNLYGQEILSIVPAALNYEIDMSSLATGTYILKATIGDQVNSFKVVKN